MQRSRWEFKKENFFGILKSSDIFGKCFRKVSRMWPQLYSTQAPRPQRKLL